MQLATSYLKIFQEYQEEFNSSEELTKLNVSYLKKAVRVLKSPVSYSNFKCSNCGNVESFKAYTSRDTHEPLFRRKRAWEIKQYLRDIIGYHRHENARFLRFLTLTVKRIPTLEFTSETLRELKGLFEKFVKRKFFRTKVKGYACVLEIKHYKIGDIREYRDFDSGKLIQELVTEELEGYHPHLHILLLGNKESFIPINTKQQKKNGFEECKEETIEWNWSDVCDKSSISLFHGSFITNIKTPESILKYESDSRFSKDYNKSLTDDDKANILIYYLTAYVTKQEDSIKPNKYDLNTPFDDIQVKTCPYIRFLKETHRFNFVTFGGVLTKSNAKTLVIDKTRKKKGILTTIKAEIPQKIEKEELDLKTKFEDQVIPKESLKRLSELSSWNSRILSHFIKEKKPIHCSVCYETRFKPLSTGEPVILSEDEIKACLKRALLNLSAA